ncbi:Uncharacterised protein [Candidatus Gugararchaeum adminiculabundum]|nr:Uncharacterised protein [Candidatus Gugararchaeum adminiculabundum]
MQEKNGFDKSLQLRIRKAMIKVHEKPELGKPLCAPLSGFFCERIGNVRIIYTFDQETVCFYSCRLRKTGY